ncbi:MAG: DNA helicase II [Piscirickettsiaceae bacterium CG_4_9_14_3_um_filter_43_564]|nr:DNA helicase II [Thiomicrospira sp.]OIP97018.1 MAG: DNA helicase II [Thiomicrospira sp. CG2_30_44_34]PIQ02734.1 MAG: DNA helicase II [Piscirickettsiaceae bacterium CG18_big_fil_WC_8_21_14_2_50_44_103]PIU39105.1 MAG: DNA helicase II [Piscirickettsiaceae bacterium CG07_land_8_20_14_0_80_44_28]PIW57934.1 MAG: DNA helicase II [Piscirickettsiaceae bacterium CG12_big_fil_rev_8_21_14_0_65_44_934]PIW77979.1 MAG: DNA helicase II [Piscirickettsiaceae bacterium CG_4_8_14_3_um_filter_44_38]PIX78263.1 
MDISYILEDLNDAQRDAVTLENQHGLILAGAGSGKTRVLVHRIAWIIEVMRVSAYHILAVTFTNKAAKEMRGRVDALIGNQSQGITLGTFHGIAYRLLRAHYQEVGLPQSFQILDADDQKRVIKRLLKAHELDEAQWPHRQVQAFINSEKEEGRRPHHIDAGHNPYVQQMVALYQAYETQCQRSGLVDFAELLLRAHELWLKNPQVLAHYQARFNYILVDEFQDTNSLQYAWLRVLAGGIGKLFIVGDDDQSIYGWRGAKIENIRRFSEDFCDVKTVRLEQNYRSTGMILAAANHLIAHNQDRMGKHLWSAGDAGDPIQLYEAFNEIDEVRYVCNQIEAWCEQGGKRSGVAVLYRSNAQSRNMEQALIQAQIPYRVYGGLRFYDRAEIKDVLAYCRLLVNRTDDAAFERVYNHPPRGIGNKTIEQIRAMARAEQVSLWQAAKQLVDAGLTARAKTAVMGFLSLIEVLDEQTTDTALSDLMIQVIARSGLQLYFEKDTSEQGQSRLENIDELINAVTGFKPMATTEGLDAQPEAMAAFEMNQFDSPLAEFLAQAALEAGEQQADKWDDCVQLMTLHAAKGLEFPLVFMIGLEEGLFPSQQSQEDAYRLEEERRLAYVGITRAEQKLVICYANRRRLHGSEFYPMPSRFIKELPSDCVQVVRLTGSVQAYGQAGYHSSSRQPSQVNETGFGVGENVFHQKFGQGMVMATEGAGEHARVQVNFKHAGTKWLVTAFAKLEKC